MFEMFLGVKSSEDNVGFLFFNSCFVFCDIMLFVILFVNEFKWFMCDKCDDGIVLLEWVGDLVDLLGFFVIGLFSFIKGEG